MIALFLGILLLCHGHATLCQKSEGDYPDANEVMWMLPETYMLQSGRSYPTLLCGYQVFFNWTSRGQTYRKYDLYFYYKDGKFLNQPLYIKNVTGYTFYMGTRPACNLMVRKDKFSTPPQICLQKFTQHCGSQAFKYTIQNCPK